MGCQNCAGFFNKASEHGYLNNGTSEEMLSLWKFPLKNGAGKGTRTLSKSLEGFCATVTPCPRKFLERLVEMAGFFVIHISGWSFVYLRKRLEEDNTKYSYRAEESADFQGAYREAVDLVLCACMAQR